MHKNLQQKNLSMVSNRQNNIRDPLSRRHISSGQVYSGSMPNRITPSDVRSVSSGCSMLPCSSQVSNRHRSCKSYSNLSTVPAGSIEVIFWESSIANSSVDFSSDDLSTESFDTDPESFISMNTDAVPSLIIHSDIHYLSDETNLESSESRRNGIMGFITQCFSRGRGTESTYSSSPLSSAASPSSASLPLSSINFNEEHSSESTHLRDSRNRIMNFINQCFPRGRETDSGRE